MGSENIIPVHEPAIYSVACTVLLDTILSMLFWIATAWKHDSCFDFRYSHYNLDFYYHIARIDYAILPKKFKKLQLHTALLRHMNLWISLFREISYSGWKMNLKFLAWTQRIVGPADLILERQWRQCFCSAHQDRTLRVLLVDWLSKYRRR